ncbi:hypothetical protein M422DRAFT_48886 [Sphaerobolus stellatus SS14]|uniref:Uncharacterized protein n=1 Tax=Sphaerobolus stellatus (strain SS14) TaxID=990650 RepID=A0A0C9VRX4_SPHS4|nr:hypothetical protein M422DRAFT_48886 [Sphaerobolus stellatus SS14]
MALETRPEDYHCLCQFHELVPIFASYLSAHHYHGRTSESLHSHGFQLMNKIVRYVKETSIVEDKPVDCIVKALTSCADACIGIGLPLELIFHTIDPSINSNGHTSTFWIIRTASSDEHATELPRYRILQAILKAPFPNYETRMDAYAACLGERSYNNFFQILRKAPGFQSATVSIEHTLDWGCDSGENVKVLANNTGQWWTSKDSFQVRWTIPNLRLRMRAVNYVGTEFVAHGRVWSISFSIARDLTGKKDAIRTGSWVFRILAVHPSPSGGFFEGGLLTGADQFYGALGGMWQYLKKAAICVRPLAYFSGNNIIHDYEKEPLYKLELYSDALQFDCHPKINPDGRCEYDYIGGLCIKRKKINQRREERCDKAERRQAPHGRSLAGISVYPLVIVTLLCKEHSFQEYALEETGDSDVKERAIELDIVQSLHCTLDVIEECAKACKALSIPLDAVFHNMHFGSHIPVFWIIIRHDLYFEGRYRLVEAFLKAGGPLNGSTREDAYRACIAVGSSEGQEFFKLIRQESQSVCLSQRSMTFWDSKIPDPIDVYSSRHMSDGHIPSNDMFCFSWTILCFQQRIRAFGQVRTEFVLQGRIWSVSFCKTSKPFQIHNRKGPVPAGSWVINFATLKPSLWVGKVYGDLRVSPRLLKAGSIFRRDILRRHFDSPTCSPDTNLTESSSSEAQEKCREIWIYLGKRGASLEDE